MEENHFDGLLPLHPDAIKLEPEAPDDSIKKVKTRKILKQS